MTYDIRAVKQAFEIYLSKPEWDWTWVIHQTFDPYKAPAYSRICEHSWRDLVRTTGATANACWGFMFAETHLSGLPHWHALLHVQENLLRQPSRKSVWRHMFNRYGRMAIRPFKPCQATDPGVAIGRMSHGIARYITKYVVKEHARRDATWDFMGFLGGKYADPRQIVDACGVDGRMIAPAPEEKEAG